jgi:hypothetical protein
MNSLTSDNWPKQVNPYAIGAGFLDYCLKLGWITREGRGRETKYSITKDGATALKKFGIDAGKAANTPYRHP